MPIEERPDSTLPLEGPAGNPSCSARSSKGWRTLLPALMMALGGGGLTWAVLWGFYPVITLPPELVTANAFTSPPEVVERAMAVSRKATLYNPVFALGVFGGLLGAALALAAGTRRSRIGQVLAAVGVASVGAGVGGVAGAAAWALSNARLPDKVEYETIQFIVLHVVTLAIVGGGIGLGVGSLRGKWRIAAAGLGAGTLGGTLAGLVFAAVAALLLAHAKPTTVVPSAALDRVLWIGIASVAIGLTVAKFTPSRASEP